MEHLSINRVVVLILLLLAPPAARAADVLQEVPNDVLGFVVVHNLNAIDAKAKWLSLELRNNTFSPLAFLKTVTNIQDGLNLDGDFLLAAYPDPRGDKSRLRYCVWLPVAEYARFSKSIGASSVDGISTVNVAGEDLLVARRGEWALVMDTDQRERMTQLVAASASPSMSPQIANWKKWIDANDVTVVATAAGVRELLSWTEDSDGDGKPDDESSDDVFGGNSSPTPGKVLVAAGANRASPHGIASILNEYRKWTAASPAIAHTIEQANMVGCGLRLSLDGDNSGSSVVGLRVAFNDGFEAEAIDAKAGVPYSIYNDGGFAFAYAGQLPKSVVETLASGYLQTVVADLKKEEHTELDPDSLHQLNDAVEQAAGEIRYAVVLAQPGGQPAPVYTNNFVALRVSSSADFISRAAEVMRLWNKANRDADGETKLIFSMEESKLGERAAREYTLDFATMLGGPAVPEIRQAMEKLFGPGGKLRLWVVAADDHTVILAQGTQEQVVAALKLYDRKQPINWNRRELSKSNRLLPAESDWRVFFDPHRYFDWESRQANAVTGVPVIGGPLVRPFRDCPPVAVAGGFHDQELWIDAVALAPTLKGAYEFLTPPKPRPEVQLRIQRAPR
jgi:hypothetical protein